VRRETLTNYVNRLTKLEEIADSFRGVSKTYVIQAGREIRCIVEPENISDAQSEELAVRFPRRSKTKWNIPVRSRSRSFVKAGLRNTQNNFFAGANGDPPHV